MNGHQSNPFGQSHQRVRPGPFGQQEPAKRGKVEKLEVDLCLNLEDLYQGVTKRRKVSRLRRQRDGSFQRIDNILILRENKHKEYKRKGNDLIYTTDITLYDAL